MEKTTKTALFGGAGGTPWDMEGSSRVLKIKICSGGAIDSVAFLYERNGAVSWTQTWGGNGGNPSEINLQEGEFLKEIHGHHGHFNGYHIIRSLTFVSNIRCYGPYGHQEGTPFSMPSVANTIIIGFHGHSGKYLDSIGVHVKREVPIKVAPWGGIGGSAWDLEAFTRLLKIKLHSRNAIDSIAFQYEHNGETVWTPTWGGDGGDPTEINLQEGEFLKAIHGHYGDCHGNIVIRSLTFVTNIHKYGPYGKEGGTSFSLPLVNAKIMGFHGRSGRLLDAIGVYLKQDEAIKVALWGGMGGSAWDMEACTHLLKIKLSSGKAIDSIAFQYEHNGTIKWTPTWGGSGGNFVEINFQEGEFLNAIHGHYGDYRGKIVIRSLTFVSNIQKYGPYGPEEGSPFSLPLENANIIGFHGRSGRLLDAIGVYLKQDEAIKVAPWGGMGGSAWDMEACAHLLKIKLNSGKAIDSIAFQYEQNGTTVWTQTWGGNGGDCIEINLQKGEFLNAIRGHYGDFHGNIVVRSLTFDSNIRNYGPYGHEGGTPFSLPLVNANIIGFHGRSSRLLDAIGVYLKRDEAIKVAPCGGMGGSAWDMATYTRLLKIKLSSAKAIDSIAFQYEHNGSVTWTPTCGGDGGNPTEINFQEGEFLTAMHGHYGDYRGKTVMRSLTFVSSIRKYGPYGHEEGSAFSLPLVNASIVGFHGRSGRLLDAIGVYLKQDEAIKVATCGGIGGSVWDMDVFTHLLKIKLHSGNVIDSIAFQYEKNGTTAWTPSWGGNGGSPTEITLQEGEFLKAIYGHYGEFYGYIVVTSLTFFSNIRKYGPYGHEEGTPFSLSSVNANIIGFHGRSGQYLDAIGVYLKREVPIKVSARGGIRGSAWELEACTYLLRIKLHSGNAIDSIAFQYEHDGTTAWTPTFGGNGGDPTEINFQEGEILAAINGHIGEFCGDIVVRSLTFVTTVRELGPYGQEVGTPFSISVGEKKIVGLHGRSGKMLNAIGVYLKPY